MQAKCSEIPSSMSTMAKIEIASPGQMDIRQAGKSLGSGSGLGNRIRIRFNTLQPPDPVQDMTTAGSGSRLDNRRIRFHT